MSRFHRTIDPAPLYDLSIKSGQQIYFSFFKVFPDTPGYRPRPRTRIPVLIRPTPGKTRYLPRNSFLNDGSSSPRARRSAIRFFAAAVAAFFARADRSPGGMVSRLRLPPILPPLRPISRVISEIALVFLSAHPSLDGLEKLRFEHKMVLVPKACLAYSAQERAQVSR